MSQATFVLVFIKKSEETTQKTSIPSQTPVLFTLGVHGLRSEDCQKMQIIYFNPRKFERRIGIGIDIHGIELKEFSSAATQSLPGGGGACDKRVAQARGR